MPEFRSEAIEYNTQIINNTKIYKQQFMMENHKQVHQNVYNYGNDDHTVDKIEVQ